ncbi:MAG: AsmA-like C-terminal region-containing protein [Pseudomonadota bacterium]
MTPGSRVRRRLFKLAAVAAATVLTLALVPLVLGPDGRRVGLEKTLGWALGWRVELAGPIDLELSLQPLITLRGVRIENPAFPSPEPLARAGLLAGRIDLAALFFGNWSFPSLLLEDGEVMVEWDDRGRLNWTAKAGDNPDRRAENTVGAAIPFMDRLEIRRSRLVVRTAPGRDPVQVELPDVWGVAGADGPVGLAGTVLVNSRPLQAALTGGTLAELNLARASWPLAGSVLFRGISCRVHGRVEKPLEAEGLDLRFDLSGDDFSQLGPLFSSDFPSFQDFNLAGRLAERESDWLFSELQARAGRTRAGGKLTVARRDGLPAVAGTVEFPEFPAVDLDPENSVSENPENPFLDGLAGYFLDVRVGIGRTPDAAPRPDYHAAADRLELRVGIADGRLIVDSGAVRINQATLEGRLEIDSRDYSALIEARAKNLDLGRVGKSLNLNSFLEGRVDLDLKAQTRGRNREEWLGSLDLDFKAVSAGVRPAPGVVLTGLAARVKSGRPELTGAGTWNSRPLSFSFLARDPTPRGVVPLAAEFKTDQVSLSIQGTASGLPPIRGLDLAAALAADSPRALTGPLGIESPETGAVSLTFRVRDEKNARLFTGISGRWGRSDLKGELRLVPGPDRPTLAGRLAANRLDLSGWLDGPKKDRSRSWSAFDSLPGWWTWADLDLELSVGLTSGLLLEIREAATQLKLKNGRLRVDSFKFRTPAGAAEGSLSLDRAGLGLAGVFRDLDLGLLWKNYRGDSTVTGRLGRLEFNYNGRDPATAAVTLAGTGGALTLTHRGLVRRLTMETFKLSRNHGRGSTLSAVGLLRDRRYSFDVSTGTSAAGKPRPVKAVLALPGAVLAAEGTLGPGPGQADLKQTWTGDSPERLTPLFEAPLPPVGRFRFTGRVKVEGEKVVLSGLEFEVGRSDLAGDLVLALDGKRPRLSGRLKSRLLALEDLKPASNPGLQAGRQPVVSGRVIPDIPFPVDLIRAVDLKIKMETDRVAAGPENIGNLSVEVGSDDGVFTAAPVEANLLGGVMSLDFRLDCRDRPAASLKMALAEIDYGRLLRDLDVTDLMSGTADLQVVLEGPGVGLREFLAQADGAVHFHARDGRLDTAILDWWSADLLTTLLKSPWKKDAKLNCLVNRFNFNRGLGKSKVMLLDASRMILAGVGTVNLADEKIDLVLYPRPKDATLINLATPVRVTGTLGRPEVFPTAAGLATTTGRLILVLQLAVVELAGEAADKLTGAKDRPTPCEAALAGKMPSLDLASQVAPRSTGAVEGLLRRLRKLFSLDQK